MKSAVKFNLSLLSAALVVTMGLASQQAVAAPTYCNSGPSDLDTSTNADGMKTSDVTFTVLNSAAVSLNATDCFGETVEGQGGNINVSFVNMLNWGIGFQELDKYDPDKDEPSTPISGLTFVLTADATTNDGTWGLTVTDGDTSTLPNLPTYVDLVFSLKAGNGSGLYFFDEILIGGTNSGDFKISFTNNGSQNPDLSNAVLFGRLGTTPPPPPPPPPPQGVPEPGMLLLMGAGLLGLGMARRRKSA